MIVILCNVRLTSIRTKCHNNNKWNVIEFSSRGVAMKTSNFTDRPEYFRVTACDRAVLRKTARELTNGNRSELLRELSRASRDPRVRSVLRERLRNRDH